MSTQLADDLLKRIFEGSLTDMVHHLLSTREVRAEELDELERLIRAGGSANDLPRIGGPGWGGGMGRLAAFSVVVVLLTAALARLLAAGAAPHRLAGRMALLLALPLELSGQFGATGTLFHAPGQVRRRPRLAKRHRPCLMHRRYSEPPPWRCGPP